MAGAMRPAAFCTSSRRSVIVFVRLAQLETITTKDTKDHEGIPSCYFVSLVVETFLSRSFTLTPSPSSLLFPPPADQSSSIPGLPRPYPVAGPPRTRPLSSAPCRSRSATARTPDDSPESVRYECSPCLQTPGRGNFLPSCASRPCRRRRHRPNRLPESLPPSRHSPDASARTAIRGLPPSWPHRGPRCSLPAQWIGQPHVR